MTDRELKKLSRAELLEMLLAQTEENERLGQEITQLKAQIDDRVLIMEQSGTMAEAALKLNEVFEAADQAAKQYLDSVKQMGERIRKAEIDRILEEIQFRKENGRIEEGRKMYEKQEANSSRGSNPGSAES